MARLLNLPGWQNSGPQHWQSQWERLDARVTRLVQDDWVNPTRAAWGARLDEALASGEPTVLIAHSLGCLLVAHVGAAPGVVGALLVAPPTRAVPGDFMPAPTRALPFPSILVASSNDPWCSRDDARALSAAWGSRFVEVGPRGHLNSESGLGTWPEGRALLGELTGRLPFELDPRLAADCHVVAESPTSLLLLMDDARYPWCVLVPKRSGVSELFELPGDVQRALADESTLLARALAEVFRADKLNVGALGNVVRQLHVHHVVRALGDPAWPGPVWGHSPRVPRDPAQRAEVVSRLFSHADLAQHFTRRP